MRFVCACRKRGCVILLHAYTQAITLYGSRLVSFRGATFVPEQRRLRNVGPVPCRPRTCSRADGGDTVKVHSRYYELHRIQRDHSDRKRYSCAFAAKLFLLVHGLR